MKQVIDMLSTEFKPLKNYLLVKPMVQETEEKSTLGIIVSMQRSVLDRPACGSVIAVGDNDFGIIKNDYIVWPNTDGIDAEFKDGTFLLLKCSSVIGKKNENI